MSWPKPAAPEVIEVQSRPIMKTPCWLIVVAVLAAAVGGAARFYRLGAKTFWFDEIATVRTCAGYQRQEFLEAVFMPPVRAGELAGRIWSLPRRGPAATIRALAKEDQNHTPLYYLATRSWMNIFGWSPAGARSLAALLGLAALGAAYIAGAVLDGRRTGLVLLALVAASPFHLAYAQEAREYAFWGAVLFLWTATFVRALAGDDRKTWAMYAGMTALAQYAHPLSMIVACGQFAAVLAWHRHVLRRFLEAAAAAALLFSPWIAVYLANIKSSSVSISWTEADLTVLAHVRSFLSVLTRPFLDIPLGRAGVWINTAAGLTFVVVALAGLKRASVPARLAVAAVLLAVPVVFFSADLFSGGRRGAVARFFAPTVVGLEVAVALALSRLSNARLAGALGLFLTAGAASCLAYSSSDTWWNKGRTSTDAAVARCMVAPGTVATTSPSNTNPLYLISLASHLDPSVPIELLRRDEPVPEMRRPVYVVTPSEWSDDLLKRWGAVRIKAPRPLWKIGSAS
jgi:uncharacterized membrane protein